MGKGATSAVPESPLKAGEFALVLGLRSQMGYKYNRRIVKVGRF